MKKIIKLAGLMSMAGILVLTSGCSCKAKQSKIDENSKLVSESKLYVKEDVSLDFVVSYTIKTTNPDNSIEEETYTISRDVDSDKLLISASIAQGEEKNSSSYKIHEENNIVYMTLLDEENKEKFTVETEADTVMELFEELDAYSAYESYKTIPYNACSSDSKDEEKKLYENLPGVFIKDSDLTCKAKKKLFGSEYTYTVGYRLSISEAVSMEIKTDEDRLVSTNAKHTIAVAGEGTKTVEIKLEVNYTSVDL